MGFPGQEHYIHVAALLLPAAEWAVCDSHTGRGHGKHAHAFSLLRWTLPFSCGPAVHSDMSLWWILAVRITICWVPWVFLMWGGLEYPNTYPQCLKILIFARMVLTLLLTANIYIVLNYVSGTASILHNNPRMQDLLVLVLQMRKTQLREVTWPKVTPIYSTRANMNPGLWPWGPCSHVFWVSPLTAWQCEGEGLRDLQVSWSQEGAESVMLHPKGLEETTLCLHFVGQKATTPGGRPRFSLVPFCQSPYPFPWVNGLFFYSQTQYYLNVGCKSSIVLGAIEKRKMC